MRGVLRDMEETSRLHQAKLTALAIEAELDSMTRISRQIASRTEMREELAAYLNGEIERESAVEGTRSRLGDAVAADPMLIGVRRYLPDGRLLAETGQTPFTVNRGETPWALGISDPKRAAGNLVIVVLVPIVQENGTGPTRIGYDEVCFTAEPLEKALAGPTLLDQAAVVELRRDGEVLMSQNTNRAQVRTEAAALSTVEDVGPGWTLHILESDAMVSARIRQRLVVVLVILVAVIGAAAAGTWRILSRLSGRMIVETKELSRLVDTRTAELKESNSRLVAANRAKSAFLSSATHELRTPLSAVLGFLDLMEDAEPEEVTEYVQIARDSGQTMLAMVNDLLDLSAIESGSLTLREAVFSPTELCYDVVKEYRERLEQKDLEAVFYVGAGLPEHALGDAHRYRQIVQNLVDNAFKYTTRGHISVGIEPAGDLIRTTVMDTGPGISPDEIEHIFEPFHRATDKKLYRLPGLGLGLGIVDRLARAMGGTVRVDSKANDGSTFVVDVRFEPTDSLSDDGEREAENDNAADRAAERPADAGNRG